ncbi:MAG: putative acetyltransferase [Leucobacter sp.]
MPDPVEFIRTAPLGTRMTVRKRIPDGFTDAVGYLRECNDDECVVETRRGLVTIRLDDVSAAKAVPPPPPRRAPRHSFASES